VRDERMVLLGGLASDAEYLRARGLALMQDDPDAPVEEADRRAYATLLAGTRTACAGDDGPSEIDEVDDPGDLATVARLHRSAGLLEHHLLARLAREESAR
jgi:hypothetical protein